MLGFQDNMSPLRAKWSLGKGARSGSSVWCLLSQREQNCSSWLCHVQSYLLPTPLATLPGGKKHAGTKQSSSTRETPDKALGLYHSEQARPRHSTSLFNTFSKEHPRILVSSSFPVEEIFREKRLLKPYRCMRGISESDNWKARK